MNMRVSNDPFGLSGMGNTSLFSPVQSNPKLLQPDLFANDAGSIGGELFAVTGTSSLSTMGLRPAAQSEIDADILSGRAAQRERLFSGGDQMESAQGFMAALAAFVAMIVKLFENANSESKDKDLGILDMDVGGKHAGCSRDAGIQDHGFHAPSGPGKIHPHAGQGNKVDTGHAAPPETRYSDTMPANPVAGPDKGNAPSKIGPTSMPEPTGKVTVNETIVVKAGEVFDGGGKLYSAGRSLGDGGQSENQKPVFRIEPGGVVKNLQYEGADGIHCMGDAKIQDVWCRDVGEDAMTMKGPGNVTWSGGGAFNANDKIFQLNAGGSFTLENFQADGFGKAIRTNGGKNFDIEITVRNSDFKNGKEAVVRTDAKDARISLEGVTFSKVPNDVLAPPGVSVTGAVKRGSKEHTG